MKRSILTIAIFIIIMNIFADKYAGEIFRIGTSVRNAAMGHNGLTDETSSAPAYWNSALITLSQVKKVEFMHSEEFGGLLKNDVISYTDKNLFSFTLLRIGSDENPETKLSNPNEPIDDENRPYNAGMFSTADYVLYAGFPFKLGNFKLGITPKIVFRDLYAGTAFGFGADLGSYWKPNRYVMFGVNVRDFFSTKIMWDNNSTETVNPGLDLEAKLSFPFPFLNVPSNLFLGFDGYSESRDNSAKLPMGVLSFDPRVGLELKMHKYYAIYTGYHYENTTSGISLFIKNWDVHYGFEMNPDFDNSHKVSLAYSF